MASASLPNLSNSARTPRPRSRQRGFALIPLLLLIVIIVVLWTNRHRMLSSVGTVLDAGEAPQRGDAALVLAGGWTGERVLKAAEVAKQGLVPYVLFSSPSDYYETQECQFEIGLARKHGYTAQQFECAPTQGRSTQEEAVSMVAELRRRRLHTILLVTSDYHTRRSAGIYRRIAPELQFIVVSAPSPRFHLDRWYENREGQKTVFYEWTKLVTSPFGI